MKVSRLMILLTIIVMFSVIYPAAAAEEEEQGVFISRVDFGTVHVNKPITYSVQVIDRSLSPDVERSEWEQVDAEVTVSMRLGSHMLAQGLEKTDNGYEGTIAFPEEGDWSITIRAVGQNDFAGFEDELEMDLTVNPPDYSLTFAWGGAMLAFALGTVYVLIRMRRLTRKDK